MVNDQFEPKVLEPRQGPRGSNQRRIPLPYQELLFLDLPRGRGQRGRFRAIGRGVVLLNRLLLGVVLWTVLERALGRSDDTPRSYETSTARPSDLDRFALEGQLELDA